MFDMCIKLLLTYLLTMTVSGWMFLLVPGCPGQITQSRETVVCVCVCTYLICISNKKAVLLLRTPREVKAMYPRDWMRKSNCSLSHPVKISDDAHRKSNSSYTIVLSY